MCHLSNKQMSYYKYYIVKLVFLKKLTKRIKLLEKKRFRSTNEALKNFHRIHYKYVLLPNLF